VRATPVIEFVSARAINFSPVVFSLNVIVLVNDGSVKYEAPSLAWAGEATSFHVHVASHVGVPSLITLLESARASNASGAQKRKRLTQQKRVSVLVWGAGAAIYLAALSDGWFIHSVN
jgi:hypothetical protein